MSASIENNNLILAGKTVSYIRIASRGRTTMIFLHGFMSDNRAIAPLAVELKTSATMLVPDLPGFGESEQLAGESTLDAYSTWLDEFISATVPPHQKIILVGYSFGSYIAIQYAARGSRALEQLVLVTPVVSIVWPVKMYGRVFRSLASLSKYAATHLYTWRPQYDFTSRYLAKSSHQASRRELLLQRRSELAALNPELVLSLQTELGRSDVRSFAPEITCPTSVITVSNDRLANNKNTDDFVTQLTGKSQSIELANAGHLVPLEEPSLLALAVDRAITTMRRRD